MISGRLLLLGFILIACQMKMQGQNQVFKGKVVDEEFEPIGGAYIRNLNSNIYTVTDSSGIYEIKGNAGDSLLTVAMGHDIARVYPQTGNFETVILKVIRFEMKPVNVYDLKDWEGFKKDFLNAKIPEEKVNTKGLPSYKGSPVPVPLRSNEFASKPPVLAYVINPISAIAYSVSRKEREKRKTWKIMQIDMSEAAYRRVVIADSVKLLVPLEREKLNDFIVYLNKNIQDKTVANEFYYKQKVVDMYKEFITSFEE